MEADGRACPTSPMLRISDSDIVLLPLELAAFSGSKNCSKSFLFLEAVIEAVDEVPPVWLLPPPLCDRPERRELAVIDMAELLLSLRAKCLSTPVVVH